MQLKDYKSLNKAKFDSYQQEGFTEQQILRPAGDTLVSLNSIINRYKKRPLDRWEQRANLMRSIFFGKNTQRKDEKNDYLYERVRVFLRKDESKIEKLQYAVNPLPPKEKYSRYNEILSEIAKDCVKACIEEFKEEAKAKMEAEKEAEQSLPVPTSEECRKRKEDSEKLRKQHIKNVNTAWDKTYESKKGESQNSNPSKKCKHVHFFEEDSDNVILEKNSVEKESRASEKRPLEQNREVSSLNGDIPSAPESSFS